MRVLSQTELNRLSRTELMVLLRKIAGELPNYPADSSELRNAHTNLLARNNQITERAWTLDTEIGTGVLTIALMIFYPLTRKSPCEVFGTHT